MVERYFFGEDSFQALATAFHILPILMGKMFERRGSLTCDGGPWNEGFAKLGPAPEAERPTGT